MLTIRANGILGGASGGWLFSITDVSDEPRARAAGSHATRHFPFSKPFLIALLRNATLLDGFREQGRRNAGRVRQGQHHRPVARVAARRTPACRMREDPHPRRPPAPKRDRPELVRVLDDVLRKGDVLVVWKLDRLARSLKKLITTAEDLEERGTGGVADRKHRHHHAWRRARFPCKGSLLPRRRRPVDPLLGSWLRWRQADPHGLAARMVLNRSSGSRSIFTTMAC